MNKDVQIARRTGNGGTDGGCSGARSGGTKPRVRHRQTAVVTSVTSVLLCVLVLGVIGLVWNRRDTIDDYDGKAEGPSTIVEVSEEASLTGLSNRSVESDVIESSHAFTQAVNENSHSSELQSGFYRFYQRMKADETVEALLDTENQVGTADVPTGVRFTDIHITFSSDAHKGIFPLISGTTCVENNDCVSKADLECVADEADLAVLGVPEWARDAVAACGSDPRRLEGFVTPGIHHLDPQQTPEQMSAKLVKESVKNYEDTRIMASADIVGLFPYKLITAASSIQMELLGGDLDKVARTILDHLDEPIQLQFDSTINYDLQDQEIITTDEDRVRKAVWSTHAKEELLETPVVSPSTEMTRVMENSADDIWLYFVAVDKEGNTIFSTTFEEHEAAIDESRSNGMLDSNR